MAGVQMLGNPLDLLKCCLAKTNSIIFNRNNPCAIIAWTAANINLD
nr:hypothetical protein [Paenibacillus psychroresistens]